MASDPFSDATRKARTYLLGLSAAGFLTSWYGVTVRDVQSVGLEMNFNNDLVPLTLTTGLAYFLVSFTVYAIDDTVNRTRTPFQDKLAEEFTSELNNIKHYTIELIDNTLKRTGIVLESNQRGNDIWLACSAFLGEDAGAFDRRVSDILNDQYGLPSPPSNDMRPAHKNAIASQAIADALTEAWRDYHHIRKRHSTGASRGYKWYRWFRVWIFDLASPPLVALAVLLIMWRHLLPSAQSN